MKKTAQKKSTKAGTPAANKNKAAKKMVEFRASYRKTQSSGVSASIHAGPTVPVATASPTPQAG